jgi:hypothetical protein
MTSSKREIDGVFVFRKFSDYNTQIKDILNEALIKSRMSTLEGIIRDNGGKVRIFTTIDIMGKGIHLTRISETSSYNVPVPKLGTQVRSYIDIDLTSENSQELLRKVVKLSLSYTPLSGQKLYRRYGFLISSLSTGSPICLLNGDRFLKIEEIHSVDYPLRRHDIYYDTIDISHFFGAFDIDQANEDWQASNVYFPYDLSKENLDFSWGT